MTRIAHIDVNAFYCSCERLFRPDLAERPIVVLSNGDGCVVARDRLVKKLGVPMGEAWFQLKPFARKHGIVAFSSNYTFYGSMSARVMAVLRQFSPDVEVYSIDEAFIDLTPQPHAEGVTTGKEIRERIRLWTGLPVCVGIGATKTQAKLGDWIAKHDDTLGGVCDLTTMSEAEKARRFADIEVREVWGIGRRIAERMWHMGLRTVGDLMVADPRRLREHFNVVLERTVRELQSEPCVSMEDAPPAKQQIIASRTFSEPVYTADEMAESMREYMGRAAFKLRRQNSVAGAVGVWIETNRFRSQDEQHNGSRTVSLPMATDDTGTLTTWAVAIMRCIFRPGIRYWKSGVMLLDIRPKGQEQLTLFDAAPVPVEDRRSTLARVLDTVNGKWGRGTLGIGSAGLAGDRRWAMRRDMLSPRYTTRWEELPVAKA